MGNGGELSAPCLQVGWWVPPALVPHCLLAVAAAARQGERARPGAFWTGPLICPALDDEPVACRGRLREGYCAAAVSCLRKDFKTRSASRAAVKSRMAAMRKTSFQLPVPAGSRFAIGTTRAAVPLAV